MRYCLTFLLGLIACEHCVSQSSYDDKLTSRLAEIRKLDFYDHGVVFVIDSVDYNDGSHPCWKQYQMYYESDMARFKYCIYEALKDTRGHRPDTARTSWTVVFGPHPSLFLRDTARLEDIRPLLNDKHPYVKLYAFAALSYRREGDLFPIIVENLKDTTQILEYTGDFGNYACPADLMIDYQVDRLTQARKNKLEKLIKEKYPHVKRGLEALLRK
jgi:hypothetical protein